MSQARNSAEHHQLRFVDRHIGPDADAIATMLDVIGVDSLEELAAKALPAGILDALSSVGLAPGLDELAAPASEEQSLAELAAETDADAIAIWDDDDIYAPWHLSAMAAALRVSRWAAPSIVWSNYHKTRGVPLVAEVATGRFHGAWGCRLEAWEACGGWPNTERQTFDQEFGQRLAMLGKPSDPCMFERPSYVYRWNGGNVSGMGEGWHGRMLEMRPTTIFTRVQHDRLTLASCRASGVMRWMW